jgi:hypothetical protein
VQTDEHPEMLAGNLPACMLISRQHLPRDGHSSGQAHSTRLRTAVWSAEPGRYAPTVPSQGDVRCMPTSQPLSAPALTPSKPSEQDPRAGTADLIGTLAAQAAARCRTEPGDLYAVTARGPTAERGGNSCGLADHQLIVTGLTHA